MKFVADLHLHSKYSRAVSQQMTLPNMAKWAKMKGISTLATGDFTHPFWFEQLKNELEEAGNGLYQLRQTTNDERLTQEKAIDVKRLALSEQKVYFLLSCEISSIYSQGGKTRKSTQSFFFPKLADVEKFNHELLQRRVNLRSDGRPIVGITSRDLTEIALSISDRALVIPAHAWTPWFSVFGSFSGFDSIEECFGDMAQYIYGVETGLSSDPAMNWQVGDLDKRAILSFSDAHSLPKMGREATVFEAEEVSYDCIYEAIKGKWEVGNGKLDSEVRSEKPNPASHISPRISFTIEFYPEEGKYHFTGHRDCNFSQSPEQSKKNGDICPVCHRMLTVGVMHRVGELKTRDEEAVITNKDGVKWTSHEANSRPPYVSLVPLGEIIAEASGVAVGTKKVEDIYENLVNNLGSEFSVLMRADLEQITRNSSPRIAEAISRVRTGNIVVEPGYDGKFGVVKIWQESAETVEISKNDTQEAQLNLFA